MSNELLEKGIELYKVRFATHKSLNFVHANFSLDEVKGMFSYSKEDTIFSVLISDKFKKSGVKYRLKYVADTTDTLDLRMVAIQVFDVPEKVKGAEFQMSKCRYKLFAEIGKKKKNIVKYEPGFTIHTDFLYSSDSNIDLYLCSSKQNEESLSIGLDYLFRFNQKPKLLEKTALHNNRISIDLNVDSEREDEKTATYHEHKTPNSDYMSITDISTILLNRSRINWYEHYVLGDRFVSRFVPSLLEFQIITIEEFNRINKN